MISKFRRLGKVVMFLVLFAFVGGFVFLDLGGVLEHLRGEGRPGQDVVGRLGKEEIKLAEYDRYLRAIFDTLRGTPTDPQMLDIHQQAWQNLIADWVWAKFLKAERITATDEEVFELLKVNPPPELLDEEALKSDGEFDRQKYWAMLAAPEHRPYFERYAQQLKHLLLREKGRWDILLSYRLTQPQAAEISSWEGTSVRATYLYFGPKLFTEPVEPGEGELERYYEANKEGFKREDRYWLRYIFFPKVPSASDSAQAREEIERAYEALVEGEEFHWVAQDFSDVPLDTNWVSVNHLDPQTRERVESLKPGELSRPFSIPQGFRLVRLDERKGSEVRLSAITVHLRPSRETLDSLRQEIEGIRVRAERENLDSLGAELGFKPLDMPPVILGRIFFPPLLDPTPLETFLASARVGAVSPPLRGQNGYFVFKLEEVERGGIPSFEKVRRLVEARWREEAEQKRLREFAEAAVEQLKSGATLEAVASKNPGLVLDSVEWRSFKECQFQRGSELAGALYALSPGETSGIVETRWGIYIVRCDGRGPQPAEAAANLQEYQEAVITRISQRLFKLPEVKDYRDAFFY